MGRPKAMMPIAGRPWWTHQSAALHALGIRQTWVVSALVLEQMNHGEFPRNFSLAKAESSQPMFASVMAGIDSLRDDPPEAVFVLPVDCPVPSGEVWRALASAGGVAIPARGATRGHPICMPWSFVTSRIDPAVLVHGMTELRLDELSLPHATLIRVGDPAVVANLNTLGDVEDWLNARKT